MNLFGIQLPAQAPESIADGSPNSWVHATHVGDWDGVPGSWLLPDPGLFVVGNWGVNQQIEESFLFVSLHFK